MKPSEPELKNEPRLRTFLKAVLRWLFEPDWTPKNPNQLKTPLDYRDEMLSKCPWKDFW